MVFGRILGSNRGVIMKTGVYWRFNLQEEVQKRTVKGGAGGSQFDFHQPARGNGNGDEY